MNFLDQSFSVKFKYKVYFTSGLFQLSNKTLQNFLSERKEPGTSQKILLIIDDGVLNAHPQLTGQIEDYFKINDGATLIQDLMIIPGGETAKNDPQSHDSIIEAIDTNGIDRHSYVAVIGGGSVLDLAGFASAIAHRGIKHIRIPTTVLSQNDSGVGVKNGINHKSKKNFLGTFVPPVAVFNDDAFLTPLKGAALVDQKRKTVNYQINPVSLNEVSVLMENAGQVNSVLISGASAVKLKIGIAGTYPVGTQTYPFSYAAGDRVFITYNYTDLANATCNVKLKCQDN